MILLFGSGVFIFFMGLSEILTERKFRRTGILTEGTVVRKVPVKFPSCEIAGGARVINSTFTVETNGGYFFTIEYEVDGEIYSVRSKKVFNRDLEKVEILYKNENPLDIMVDGFYKVGNQKYYWLISGIVLGIIPLILYSIFVIFPS